MVYAMLGQKKLVSMVTEEDGDGQKEDRGPEMEDYQ